MKLTLAAPSRMIFLRIMSIGDIGLGNPAKERVQRLGTVGDTVHRDSGLVPHHRRARHAPAQAASIAVGDNPGAGLVAEGGSHGDRNAVLLGKLDRPRLHHPGAQAGQLHHLIVADPVDLPSLGNDPGIGRRDPVDIGVDLARIGPENGRQGHGGRVRSASAQGRDLRVAIDPLKARDDRDLALPSAWKTRSVEISRIRALLCRLSVRMPIWAAVKLMAGTPRDSMAIAIRATLTCSPVPVAGPARVPKAVR